MVEDGAGPDQMTGAGGAGGTQVHHVQPAARLVSSQDRTAQDRGGGRYRHGRTTQERGQA